MAHQSLHLEVQSLSKRFGAFAALREVSLAVREGEVVGLIGENGAGKSTLLNVLSGVFPTDGGALRLRGTAYAPRSYREAMEAGVFRVYQEPALIPTLRVFENFVLGLETHFTRGSLLRVREMRRQARDALLPVADVVDPDELTGRYGASVRQVVEILRALFAARVLGVTCPLILLDEPTAALSVAECELLFRTIEQSRGSASFVFVSHRLVEIQRLSDRAYVLKDGQLVAEVGPGAAPDELHALMVGRSQAEDFYCESNQRAELGEPVVAVSGLSGQGFRDVSFVLRAGETLGISGVVGSGKASLGRVLAGDARRTAGSISIAGRELRRDTPAGRRRAGLGYVPQDRVGEGLVGIFPVSWNTSLASLQQREFGTVLLRPRHEREATRRWIEQLSIRTRGPETPVGTLSGGNQQKVVLAKWLQAGIRVLVLDNPTRGVDAGAKFEIYKLLRALSAEGLALVVISDDLPEVIGISNRVLVMKDGAVTGEFDAARAHKPAETTLISATV